MSTLTTRSGKGSPLTNTEVDTNFTNLNSDKYQSGDNIVAGTLSATGTLTLGVNGSVTAAGSTQGDATALTKTYNIVNTASANQGVKLPDCAAGVLVSVFNSTANTIKVYPASSEAINDLALNVSISVSPDKGVDFIGVSATQWQETSNIGDENVIATTIDASGLASLDGGIDVDGAFTVANTSGNISTSGTLSVTSTASLLGDLKYGVATVSTAGTTQGTATTLTETINVVTTASANQGVKLKSAATGLKVEIYNNTTANIKVYPNTSDTIDGGSANVAKTLSARSSMILVCSNATDWEIQRPIAIYNSSGTLLN